MEMLQSCQWMLVFKTSCVKECCLTSAWTVNITLAPHTKCGGRVSRLNGFKVSCVWFQIGLLLSISSGNVGSCGQKFLDNSFESHGCRADLKTMHWKFWTAKNGRQKTWIRCWIKWDRKKVQLKTFTNSSKIVFLQIYPYKIEKICTDGNLI